MVLPCFAVPSCFYSDFRRTANTFSSTWQAWHFLDVAKRLAGGRRGTKWEVVLEVIFRAAIPLLHSIPFSFSALPCPSGPYSALLSSTALLFSTLSVSLSLPCSTLPSPSQSPFLYATLLCYPFLCSALLYFTLPWSVLLYLALFYPVLICSSLLYFYPALFYYSSLVCSGPPLLLCSALLFSILPLSTFLFLARLFSAITYSTLHYSTLLYSAPLCATLLLCLAHLLFSSLVFPTSLCPVMLCSAFALLHNTLPYILFSIAPLYPPLLYFAFLCALLCFVLVYATLLHSPFLCSAFRYLAILYSSLLFATLPCPNLFFSDLLVSSLPYAILLCSALLCSSLFCFSSLSVARQFLYKIHLFIIVPCKKCHHAARSMDPERPSREPQPMRFW